MSSPINRWFPTSNNVCRFFGLPPRVQLAEATSTIKSFTPEELGSFSKRINRRSASIVCGRCSATNYCLRPVCSYFEVSGSSTVEITQLAGLHKVVKLSEVPAEAADAQGEFKAFFVFEKLSCKEDGIRINIPNYRRAAQLDVPSLSHHSSIEVKKYRVRGKASHIP